MPYEQSAQVYDAIYEDMKDYEREARRVRDLIKKYTQLPGTDLLDVACGTGLHDQYLQRWYKIEGLDLSKDQLAIARRRLPKVKFYQGDMTDFDFGKQYDVVTCLFSSIGHLTTIRQLKQGIAEMAKHLKPGGVLIVEPWITPDKWKRGGTVSVNFVELPQLKVARFTKSSRKGRLTSLEMHYLVTRSGNIEYFTEHHQAALYSVKEYKDAFRAAGLKVWHDQKGLMGRGVFIGRKPK